MCNYSKPQRRLLQLSLYKISSFLHQKTLEIMGGSVRRKLKYNQQQQQNGQITYLAMLLKQRVYCVVFNNNLRMLSSQNNSLREPNVKSKDSTLELNTTQKFSLFLMTHFTLCEAISKLVVLWDA